MCKDWMVEGWRLGKYFFKPSLRTSCSHTYGIRHGSDNPALGCRTDAAQLPHSREFPCPLHPLQSSQMLCCTAFLCTWSATLHGIERQPTAVQCGSQQLWWASPGDKWRSLDGINSLQQTLDPNTVDVNLSKNNTAITSFTTLCKFKRNSAYKRPDCVSHYNSRNEGNMWGDHEPRWQ